MTRPPAAAAGLMIPPGGGRRIVGGGLQATLKVSGGAGALTSTFEIILPAGYDVGAHVHSIGEELFYVVEGEVDLLAFEPLNRATPNWHDWVSSTGQQYLRGAAGSLLFVPAGCPHAFANRSSTAAKLLFQSAPSGHENYFDELAALLVAAAALPDQAAITELRQRFDIEQLTPFDDGRGVVSQEAAAQPTPRRREHRGP